MTASLNVSHVQFDLVKLKSWCTAFCRVTRRNSLLLSTYFAQCNYYQLSTILLATDNVTLTLEPWD